MSDFNFLEESGSGFMTFRAGTRIVTENELSRKLFIIKKGKARVFKTYHHQRIKLAVLGEGEIFGEMSFIDAQPRSASVEALTDLTVLVLDGDDAKSQIARLPEWVLPIFKIIFHRFRETGHKLAALGNLREFQLRALKNEKTEKLIYIELGRFLQTLKTCYLNKIDTDGHVRSDQIYQELDEKLEPRRLGLKSFWQQLEENEFFDREPLRDEAKVVLNMDLLDSFLNYINIESKKEHPIILSYPAFDVLEKLLEALGSGTQQVQIKSLLPDQTSQLNTVILRELKAIPEIKILKEVIEADGEPLSKVYLFQSILTSFDYSRFSSG